MSRTIDQKIQDIRNQASQGIISQGIAEERIAWLCEQEALKQIEASKKPTFCDYANDFLDGLDGRQRRS